MVNLEDQDRTVERYTTGGVATSPQSLSVKLRYKNDK